MENTNDVRYNFTEIKLYLIVSSVFRFLKSPRFVIPSMNRPLSSSGALPRLRHKIPEMHLSRGSVAV